MGRTILNSRLIEAGGAASPQFAETVFAIRDADGGVRVRPDAGIIERDARANPHDGASCIERLGQAVPHDGGCVAITA